MTFKLLDFLNDCQDAFSLKNSNFKDIDLKVVRSASGDSLLHAAVTRGDIELVKELCENGLNVNAQGDLGYTPLHCAADYKFTLIYKYLVSQGGSQDVLDNFGKTPADLFYG
ncbi:ankyrin repeat domain-containing protein [Haloferula chungangensis]|uniref:Ankyrin repeat domain-containing protein n=1 Tax=Haloferula chungangensis TaxID=1048331 RepID=A0ABW2L8U9_9BACT